jgi:hypothetical protein
LVQRYLLAESKGESTCGLDLYLACKPWESRNRYINYNYAVRNAWIEVAPGRHEIDGACNDVEIEAWFDREFDPASRLELDPYQFRLRHELLPDRSTSLERIRGLNPWIYHSLLTVWEDARGKYAEMWDLMKGEKFSDRVLTVAYEASWGVFERLVDKLDDEEALTTITREEFETLVKTSWEKAEASLARKNWGKQEGK